MPPAGSIPCALRGFGIVGARRSLTGHRNTSTMTFLRLPFVLKIVSWGQMSDPQASIVRQARSFACLVTLVPHEFLPAAPRRLRLRCTLRSAPDDSRRCLPARPLGVEAV